MLQIICGDALTELRKLPPESVHCCVTSPPYWGLRDYGTAAWEGGDAGCDHRGRSQTSDASTLNEWKNGGGQRYKEETGGMPFSHECGKCGAKRIDSQLGLEKTPEEYVARMVEIFREVRRVLRRDGTLWLNLGDSYAGSWGNYGGQNRGNGEQREIVSGSKAHQKSYDGLEDWRPPTADVSGLKPKDLCGIPWRVAFALQADGWWLRSDIIWAKPNPMPESVTDRPTKAHEYLFLLTKASSYFYDAEAIKEKASDLTHARRLDGLRSAGQTERSAPNQGAQFNGNYGFDGFVDSGNRNKRSVWTVATAPYPEAHFATYPPDLIKPCILAGTSAKGCCAKCGAPWERILWTKPMVIDRSSRTHEFGRTRSSGTMLEPAETKTLRWKPTCECDVPTDMSQGQYYHTQPCTVLDPFAGSGTTGQVALNLSRSAILIDLKYQDLQRQRCAVTTDHLLLHSLGP